MNCKPTVTLLAFFLLISCLANAQYSPQRVPTKPQASMHRHGAAGAHELFIQRKYQEAFDQFALAFQSDSLGESKYYNEFIISAYRAKKYRAAFDSYKHIREDLHYAYDTSLTKMAVIAGINEGINNLQFIQQEFTFVKKYIDEIVKIDDRWLSLRAQLNGSMQSNAAGAEDFAKAQKEDWDTFIAKYPKEDWRLLIPR